MIVFALKAQSIFSHNHTTPHNQKQQRHEEFINE
jgi:hypothetical protein